MSKGKSVGSGGALTVQRDSDISSLRTTTAAIEAIILSAPKAGLKRFSCAKTFTVLYPAFAAPREELVSGLEVKAEYNSSL